jgi:hypothetical protein
MINNIFILCTIILCSCQSQVNKPLQRGLPVHCGSDKRALNILMDSLKSIDGFNIVLALPVSFNFTESLLFQYDADSNRIYHNKDVLIGVSRKDSRVRLFDPVTNLTLYSIMVSDDFYEVELMEISMSAAKGVFKHCNGTKAEFGVDFKYQNSITFFD